MEVTPWKIIHLNFESESIWVLGKPYGVLGIAVLGSENVRIIHYASMIRPHAGHP